MVHSDTTKREKAKPRGRAFPKGNIKGKPNPTILADPGHKSGDERGVIAPTQDNANGEALNPLLELPRLVMEKTDQVMRENLESDGIEMQLSPEAVKTVEKIIEKQKTTNEAPTETLTIVDEVNFVFGENKISLRLSKTSHRLFRLQIFLNDRVEIRPSTYTGSSMAMSYWNLLKDSMSK